MEGVELLISNSNNPSSLLSEKDGNGNMPLHIASLHRHTDIIKKLIEYSKLIEPSVSINEKNNDGDTPSYNIVVNDRYVDIVKLFLKHEVNPSERNNHNRTMLQRALFNKCFEIVKLLLEYGTSPNEKDNHGNISIHISARYGDIRIIKLLLKYKVNINEKNNYGYTPLFLTSKNNRIKTAIFLINSGADYTILNNENKDCLSGFSEDKRKYIMENVFFDVKEPDDMES